MNGDTSADVTESVVRHGKNGGLLSGMKRFIFQGSDVFVGEIGCSVSGLIDIPVQTVYNDEST